MSKGAGLKRVATMFLTVSTLAASSAQGVRVVAHEAERRVDVRIDGKPFTSYVWPESLKKPVLYPLITDEGTTVTRGFPLDPRPGERVDHPHHAGLWFNYGNANGFDFWNNSDAIKPEDRARMGNIVFKKIVSTRSGPSTGRTGRRVHLDYRIESADSRSNHSLRLLAPQPCACDRSGDNSQSTRSRRI